MPSAADRVAELEAVGADLWVAPEVEELDGWRLRFAHGLTGRANSVLPNAGALGVDEKIEQVEAWYAARDLPARYQMTLAAQPGLETALVARGYEQRGDAVGIEIATLPETTASIGLSSHPDEQWIELWAGSRSFDRLDVARALLTGSPGETAFARIEGAAVGRAVAVGRWLGITSMATLPAARRRGYARAIVESLIAWGRARGCTNGLLQVETTNEPARALYAGYGFAKHHEYRYLVAP
ncbi:MAG TPA: GNAT family N-acetyltransferase [Gaiellaceae bacterium]|jgi:GNAT superfamily N-acetyltransferase|nr:GNAT family N-acetyltransferase [Gaiellaceae bacterium]